MNEKELNNTITRMTEQHKDATDAANRRMVELAKVIADLSEDRDRGYRLYETQVDAYLDQGDRLNAVKRELTEARDALTIQQQQVAARDTHIETLAGRIDALVRDNTKLREDNRIAHADIGTTLKTLDTERAEVARLRGLLDAFDAT